MLCDNCGKNEVEVLIRQVIDEEVKNLSLCRACAEKMGFMPLIPSITISFSIGESPPKQRKIRKAQTKRREQPAESSMRCPTCGSDISSFRETGILGCPDCYESFRVPLGVFLHKTQGAESHWVASDAFRKIGVTSGEINHKMDVVVKEEKNGNIAKLRLELNEAISREDYERAAQLRDILAPLVGGADKNND
jgi:protein arginine kinase activator